MHVQFKGAPEVVLGRCTHYANRSQTLPIDDDFKDDFELAYKSYGGQGERVLGFRAYLPLDGEQFGPDKDSFYTSEPCNFPTNGYVFCGLMFVSL